MAEQVDLHTVLHELWLRIHLRRFDADNFGDKPRPDYVSKERAVDSFYAGATKAERIVATFAREHGIEHVYDTPTPPTATPDPAGTSEQEQG